jgi:tetratricopeptide (TPR) repeat protein
VSWPRSLERPADREQLRQRALAFAGIWFLLAGLLWALGFGIVLLASLLLLLLGGLAVGTVWLVRRYQMSRAVGAVRAVGPPIERASRRLKSSIDELDAGRRIGRLAGGVAHQARTASQQARSASQQARTALEARQQQRKPAQPDPRRQARRLNERGAQLRREGDYEGAAEQHRQALRILHELDDRREEALTLNNLALALVHTGGVTIAVEHFEQALALLRQIGDEAHEGQVIANLGVVRRKQGRDEDAATLFSAALDKLPPESSAYRRVEEELRRAS